MMQADGKRPPTGGSKGATAPSPPAPSSPPAKGARPAPPPPQTQASPSRPGPAPDSLEGHIDKVQNGVIFGWAWNRNRPEERVAVEILHAGQRIGTVIADAFRVDLKRLGIGDGGHAFTFPLPEAARQAKAAAITARFAGTTTALIQPRPSDPSQPAAAPALAIEAKPIGIPSGVPSGAADGAKVPAPDCATGPAAEMSDSGRNTAMVVETLQHRLDQLERSVTLMTSVVQALSLRGDELSGKLTKIPTGEDPAKLTEAQVSTLNHLQTKTGDIEKMLQNLEAFLYIGMVDRLRGMLQEDFQGTTQRRLISQLRRSILLGQLMLGLGVAALATVLLLQFL